VGIRVVSTPRRGRLDICREKYVSMGKLSRWDAIENPLTTDRGSSVFEPIDNSIREYVFTTMPRTAAQDVTGRSSETLRPNS